MTTEQGTAEQCADPSEPIEGNGRGEAEDTLNEQSESNGFPAREWPLILALVVSALMLLVAVIHLNPPGAFRDPPESNLQRRRRAEQTMDYFAGVLQMYQLRHRRMPTTLEDLMDEDPQSGEVWLPSIPSDPWGNPYRYTPLGGKQFRILSFGEDGQAGTEDDIFSFWPPA